MVLNGHKITFFFYLDDQFDEAINASQVARAFKIDRRHNKFSIILITQVFTAFKFAKK